jgi:hypothetical protein
MSFMSRYITIAAAYARVHFFSRVKAIDNSVRCCNNLPDAHLESVQSEHVKVTVGSRQSHIQGNVSVVYEVKKSCKAVNLL